MSAAQVVPPSPSSFQDLVEGMPRVTLVSAAIRPAIDYVLDSLPSGSVGVLVGRGAVGKSMLALSIGFGVASGRDIAGLGCPPATGHVTIIAGEDPADLLQERLFWLRRVNGIDANEAADIDGRLTILSGVGTDLRLFRSDHAGWLPTLRRLCEGQRLVILDPLVRLIEDENDNGAATDFMTQLYRVCLDTGCTILLIHHVRKGGSAGGEDWEAARGASALTFASRWQASMRTPTNEDLAKIGVDQALCKEWVRFSVDKINYGKQPDPVLIHRGPGGVMESAPPELDRHVQHVAQDAALAARRHCGGLRPATEFL